MMVDKLIYIEEHLEKYKRDTWVELISNGHYAITQTDGFEKKTQSIVFLTRQQIEQILKEEEVES